MVNVQKCMLLEYVDDLRLFRGSFTLIVTDQFEFLANRSSEVDSFSVDVFDGDDNAAVRADLSERLHAHVIVSSV